jgi:eukaryotic-like serine/threonine-protein kinase
VRGCPVARPPGAAVIVERERVAAALPGYTLGEGLGQGAFGLVLAGKHRLMDRDVAIKVMSTEGFDGELIDFAAEARVLGSLDHPHVVRVHEYVEAQGLCLVVMELLTGGTLTRRRATLGPRESCAVGLAVAAALEHAHGRGVLHRDIKADNVLFAADGTAKVSDFGLAKLLNGTAATASGMRGTPTYMAPEQIEGGRLGPATDIYALGVLLYHLLSGRPPFDPAQPLHQLLDQHLNASPPAPDGVPDPVVDVVLRALAKKPSDRQPDAHSFAVDLDGAARAVYGPDWLARTGLPLYLNDLGRPATGARAALLPPAAPFTPAAADSTASGRSGVLSRRGWLLAAGLTVVPAGALTAGIVATGNDTTRSKAKPAGSATPVPATAARATSVRVTRIGTLTGHTDTVTSVAFSPAGHTLASSSNDATVRLWDVSHPARPAALGQALTGDTRWVQTIAFSPDGRTLASGGGDGMVRLWDVADPARARQIGRPLRGHTHAVSSVVFSPDGRTLVSGGDDWSVRLWNVADPAAASLLKQFLPDGPGYFPLATFSPDGHILVTASTSGDNTNTVRLWDVLGPARLSPLGLPLPLHNDDVDCAVFSPDGHTLAIGSFNGRVVHLWDVRKPAHPRQIGQVESDRVYAVAFRPDGRTLASAVNSADTGIPLNRVRLWDVFDPGNPRMVDEFSVSHDVSVECVAFSPDGHTLATGGSDAAVRLWTVS